jgi:hypothetical protein
VLADSVGKLNQPMNRLAFQRQEIRAIPQAMGRCPELRPSVEEIDEVADRKARFAFPASRPFKVIFVGRIHSRKLGHIEPCGGVKKT